MMMMRRLVAPAPTFGLFCPTNHGRETRQASSQRQPPAESRILGWLVVMVMVMVICSALVRSHQSTYEGSFGPVPPLLHGDAAVPQTMEGLTRPPTTQCPLLGRIPEAKLTISNSNRAIHVVWRIQFLSTSALKPTDGLDLSRMDCGVATRPQRRAHAH